MSIFYDYEQDTPEWHKARLEIVNASDTDKIMTPAKRAFSSQAPGYMYRKLAEWITGEPTEIESYQAPWMERGQDLEDEAVRTYEGMAEVETLRGGFFTTDDGMAGCSPDRRVGEVGLVEVKCPLLPRQIEAFLTGDGAEAHRCQIQAQLWISEREWVDVFTYHPRLVIPSAIRVARDESFIADLAKTVGVFIAQMLDCRKRLLDANPHILDTKLLALTEAAALKQAVDDVMGVQMSDVDDILAAQRDISHALLRRAERERNA